MQLTTRRFSVCHRWLYLPLLAPGLIAFVICVGCGGGGSSPSPSTPTPTLSPPTPVPPLPVAVPTVTLQAGKTTILFGEATTIRWHTQDALRVVTSNMGVSPESLAGETTVAPVESTTYTITVEGAPDASPPQQTASLTVQVAAVTVALPETATIPLSGDATFTAQVIGAVDTTVTWTLQSEIGGTFDVSPSGAIVLHAPSRTGEFTITATSNTDPRRSATTRIRVAAAAGNVVVE